MVITKVLSSDECKCLSTNAEKMKHAIDKWNLLTEEQRYAWREKAKGLEKFDASKLSETQRKNEIYKAKRQLVSQLAYLENLGCELSVLMLEAHSGEVRQFGTNKGIEFLNENNRTVLNFIEFFDCPKRENYGIADIASLFNRKYSEACGKPSLRVPYQKGGFKVTGLPDGLTVRKPSTYGPKQINEIMKGAENITFHLLEKESPLVHSEVSDKYANHERVLSKVIDKEKIAACLTKHQLIVEEDLEVVSLDLLASDFSILTTELSHCFDKDAMTSLMSNYKITMAHSGYILPAYTDSDEPYWLFYHPGKSVEIEGMQPEDKVWGYWLDKTPQKLQYKLLVQNKKTSIVALNLICHLDKELGSLRLKKSIPVINGIEITLPSDFDQSVLECLTQQGFTK